MIKVEKGMCEIKAVNGVPDIMTDLACIIRSIRTTMVEKRDYSEAETKELVEQAVRLGFATDEEITQEAMAAMGKVMMLLKRPCTGQRRKCLHTLRSILLRFTKTVEQNLWNYWNRARFRKRICGSILHSGLRILTEWH